MLHILFSFFEDILLRYPSASENCLGSLLSLNNQIAIYSLTFAVFNIFIFNIYVLLSLILPK